MNSKTDNGRIDLWVRQVTLMAVLLVALALIVIGVALYTPHAHARPAESHIRSCLVDPSSAEGVGDTDRAIEHGAPGGEGADADISSRDEDQFGKETK
jgi:hypothetical protein